MEYWLSYYDIGWEWLQIAKVSQSWEPYFLFFFSLMQVLAETTSCETMKLFENVFQRSVAYEKSSVYDTSSAL